MKPLIKQLVIILLLFTCSTVLAEEQRANDPKKETKTQSPKVFNVIILEKSSGNKNKRPAAPSRQMVQCYYDGESIVIDFNFPEGECLVTVTDLYTGYPQSHTIDSSENDIEIYVGDINESSIEISTEYGHNYSGILSAE